MNSSCLYDNIIIISWAACIFLVLYDIQLAPKKCKIASIISSNMFGVFLMHGYIIKYWGLTELVHNGLDSTIMFVIVVIASWLITYSISKVPYLNKAVKY